MTRLKILLLLMVLLFAGCIPQWVKTQGLYTNSGQKYSVEPPWGWMMLKGQSLLVSKDGIWLESIIVGRDDIKYKFKNTKKKIVKDMLPEEVAQVLIDDLSSDKDIKSFEILENNPVKISCMPGFKLFYIVSDKEGLKKKGIQYGFLYENWIYSIAYSGTDWHYFDKGLSNFEAMVRSFRFLPAGDCGGIEGEELITIQQAPQVPLAAPSSEVPKPAQAKAKAVNYAEYYRYLYKTISSAVKRPKGAGTGTINLSIILKKDGTLEDTKILDGSSEDQLLRDAVINTIRGLSPFEVFPEDIQELSKVFTVTLEFRQR